MIPTVPGSEMDIQTPARAVPLDASRLMGRQRGMQALSGGLEQLGGVADEIGQDMQRARNAAAVADAERMMRASHQEFLDSLRGDTDEETWGIRAKEKQAETYQAVMAQHGGKVSPVVRRQIDMAFKNWSSAFSSEVATHAKVQVANRAKTKLNLAIDEANKDSDFKSVQDVLAMGVRAKLYTPEEAQVIAEHSKGNIQRYQVDRGIAMNPIQVLSDLRAGKFPAIDPNTRLALERQAEVESNKLRIQTKQQVIAQMDSGQVVTRDMLDPLVKTGKMNASDVDPLLKRQAGLIKNEDQPRLSAAVLAKITELPHPADDETRAKQRAEVMSSPEYLSLQPSTRKVADDFMDSRWGKMGEPSRQERPSVAERNRMDKQDREDFGVFLPPVTVPGAFHLFGPNEPETRKPADYSLKQIASMSEEDVKSNFGMSKREVIEKEQANWADYLTRMREFERQNPDASDAQLNDAARKIKERYLVQAVQRNLDTPKAPVLQPEDKAALDWANAHPDDPRATQIFGRLIGRNRTP